VTIFKTYSNLQKATSNSYDICQYFKSTKPSFLYLIGTKKPVKN